MPFPGLHRPLIPAVYTYRDRNKIQNLFQIKRITETIKSRLPCQNVFEQVRSYIIRVKIRCWSGCHWDPVVKHSSSGQEHSHDWQCLNSPTSWLLLCHMNYVQERTIAGISDNPGQNNGFSLGQRGCMALSRTGQMLPRRGRPGDARGAIPTPLLRRLFLNRSLISSCQKIAVFP